MDKTIMDLFKESVSVSELEKFFIQSFDYNVVNEINLYRMRYNTTPTTIIMTIDMYAMLKGKNDNKDFTYRGMKVETYKSNYNILFFELKPYKQDLVEKGKRHR